MNECIRRWCGWFQTAGGDREPPQLTQADCGCSYLLTLESECRTCLSGAHVPKHNNIMSLSPRVPTSCPPESKIRGRAGATLLVSISALRNHQQYLGTCWTCTQHVDTQQMLFCCVFFFFRNNKYKCYIRLQVRGNCDITSGSELFYLSSKQRHFCVKASKRTVILQ